jgi:hypothetical protein
MNEEQAAEYLGITIQKLREYVAQGRIAATHIRTRPIQRQEKQGDYSKTEPNRMLEIPPDEIRFDIEDLKRLKEELRAEKERKG